MANIAVNIKRLRLQKGITQEAFAKSVNVSRQAISSWETGRTQPDIEMLGVLADSFGISIEELIYGEKRNVKIDDTEKKYLSTATVVLSVLGGLMMLAGAILILVWSWKHIPVIAKGVFALVPAGLGLAFAVYVLIKMNSDSFMKELSAPAWAMGNIFSLIFVNELFEYNFPSVQVALFALFLVLPAMFIMESVATLTVFYGLMAYIMSGLWELTDKGEALFVALLTGALFVGVIFVHFCRKKMDYTRHRYAQAISVVIAMHFIYMIFVDQGFINPFVALMGMFSICYITEKENDLTNPIYLLGTLGSTVTLHLCLVMRGDLIGGELKEEIPVFILSALSCVIAVVKNEASLKSNKFKVLQLTVIAVGALFSIIHSAAYSSAYSVYAESTPLTVALDSASVFVFSLCIFVLALIFIMQGLKENRLYPLNLGVISIAALAIILLTAFETDMLIKGCVMLLMGGILMFMNLKITKNKETTKKSETVTEASDTQV